MKNKGFTLIELLIVIAIIGLLAAILLPALGAVNTRAYRAEAKTIVTQLTQAMKQYETDQGAFPPDGQTNVAPSNITNNANSFNYANDIFVRFLDGDATTNPTGYTTPKIQYFEFKEQFLDTATQTKYLDRFEQAFWYHNFQDESATFTGKVRSTTYPLHPRYNAILFQGIQIYTRANFTSLDSTATDTEAKDIEAYPSGITPYSADDFSWITNYSER